MVLSINDTRRDALITYTNNTVTIPSGARIKIIQSTSSTAELRVNRVRQQYRTYTTTAASDYIDGNATGSFEANLTSSITNGGTWGGWDETTGDGWFQDGELTWDIGSSSTADIQIFVDEDNKLVWRSYKDWVAAKNDPKHVKREKVRAWRRHHLATPRRRTSLEPSITPQEEVARNLLRDLVSEKDYRRYITNGFLMIPGKSGRWYQVFGRGGNGVYVYHKNKCVGFICIHTEGRCPPTDHVINMKTLIEIDETLLYKKGNYRPHFPDYGSLAA